MLISSNKILKLYLSNCDKTTFGKLAFCKLILLQFNAKKDSFSIIECMQKDDNPLFCPFCSSRFTYRNKISCVNICAFPKGGSLKIWDDNNVCIYIKMCNKKMSFLGYANYLSIIKYTMGSICILSSRKYLAEVH